ncbi:CHAT domain-containing protein [Streptomyces massasporeus]|uniref:CHAT domain-containing protein n=1 Tax=Streptomyces massasporeus TaxID=67324 RepID=UPI0034030EAA
MRDEWLNAVRSRLRRVEESGDLTLVLQPDADREARNLGPQLDGADPEASFVLGWFHWYRHRALPCNEVRADLDAAVEAFATCFAAGVVDLPQPLLPLLADAAVPHATRTLRHAQRSMDPDLLTGAVALWRRIVSATLADHPSRAEYMSNLAVALAVRFERTGAVEDLEAAIDLFRQAVEAEHPDVAGHLSNLGAALHRKFESTGVLADLTAAIDVGQRAVDAVPVDHPNRAMYLINLSAALWRRFEHTGAAADLDTAVELGRRVVETTTRDHPDRAAHLATVGNALRLRFEHRGDVDDLDAAVNHYLKAVEATPAEHPDWAGHSSNLGIALRQRFECTGETDDLDTAVDHYLRAVAATPTEHPNHALYLSNLGNALDVRFARIGATEDLITAVHHSAAAVASARSCHPDRAKSLSNHGLALHEQFERTGADADLHAAISYYRSAVDATPTGHPDRARHLSNLGAGLRLRFERTGQVADLSHAIDLAQQAVAAASARHPSRTTYLTNLASALRARFKLTGAVDDLDLAIDLGQQAMKAASANHPTRATYLINQATALRTRFHLTGAVDDLDKAISYYLEAADLSSAAPSARIRAGAAAADLLAECGDVRRAADAAEAAVRLLSHVVPRRLHRGDQQAVIGEFAGLAGTAAALALTVPDSTVPERAGRALALLEAGRAVLLGQALEVRGDLTELQERHPDLARCFVKLRRELDRTTSPSAPTGAGHGAGDPVLPQGRTQRERHHVATEFIAVLTEIRNLDGFTTFALPPATEELLAEAAQGPVVAFNISGYRSDALLLTGTGITSLELPSLTLGVVIDQVNTFLQALDVMAREAEAAEHRAAQTSLSEVLQWLWDAAVGPVLQALGYDGPLGTDEGRAEGDAWPRLWWMPGGLLGLLPVHAAGYHTDSADDPHRRTALDRVVSSYTPTIRALRHARERSRGSALASCPPGRSLIVAMPDTPGRSRLDWVAEEAAALKAFLPDPVLLQGSGPDDVCTTMPTKARVLEHLPTCTIAHFACHGITDPIDPSSSRLLLHDHADAPLTVAALASVTLARARLAFLSACRTVATDATELLDESIHLASAFQLAGFPHVIGTLWEIDDQLTGTITRLFYDGLRIGSELIPDRAAHALHKAVRSLRDGHGLPAPFDRSEAPWLWAVYTHSGA